MIKHYIKVTLRNLVNYKIYTLINVMGLAMGLACCIIITLFVLSELKYDSYQSNKDEIYRLTLDIENLSSGSRDKTALSSILWAPTMLRDYPEIHNFNRVMQENNRLFKVADTEFQVQRLVFADENVFDFFTWPLLQGDPATALSEPYSVVINETVARSYFGDQDPLGRVLLSQDVVQQDGGPADWNAQFRVTGVMEDIPYKSHLKPAMVFSFRTLNDIYNADVTAGVAPNEWYWRGRVVHNYLRLVDQASVRSLEMKFPEFLDNYVGDATSSRGYIYHPYLQRLDEIHLEGNVSATFERGGNKNQIYLFSAIALFVLVIACINFMNLSTARYSSRAREIGVRKVVGAQHSNLVCQFLGESVFLTLLALVMAIGMVFAINPIFYSYINQDFYMPLQDIPAISLGILALAILVGVISGGYPAFFLANFKTTTALKAKFSIIGKGKTLRKALVVMQFAITIFFIFGTFTVYNQLNYMQTQELGVKTEQIMVLPPEVSRLLLPQLESYRNELLNLPYVRAVTVSTAIPGRPSFGDIWGEEGKAGEAGVSLSEFAVDYEYIDFYGLELLAGRMFDRERATDAAPAQVSEPGYEMAGIINAAAMRAYGWSSPGDALGRRLIRDPISNDYTTNIIGVVKDFHFDSLQQEIQPMILYISPFVASNFRYISIELMPQEVVATIDSIRENIQPLLGETAFDYFFVDQAFGELYSEEERMVEVFGYISSLTIFIACLGLFGLASFAAEQRTKEIGIRKLLGASIESVVILLSLDFIKLVAISTLIAFPISYYVMTNWLESFAYRVQIGPGTFLFAGLLALLIALLTVSSQAMKAAIQNPVKSLRYE